MESGIIAEIVRFVEDNPANALDGGSIPYFETPLVGFAGIDDPLFTEYKTIIGDFHLTPRELFAAEFGAELQAGTVVCWILPISAEVCKSNRSQSEYPSREWSHTRSHGEALNGALRRHLVDWLAGIGHRGVAPQLSGSWKELPDTAVGRASTWSERHAAYAAGLGTFSLNDALITVKGITHRCGSVVTDLVLPPSERVDRGYAYNCLYHREGSCAACIGRCPVGAISFKGHDKKICCDYVYGKVPEAVSDKYGVKMTGCGLCQTRVPCERGIPRGRRLE